MFTTLAVAMTLSGAVAIETPIRAAADRPALVQVAANGKMFGGMRFQTKPVLAEKLRKPLAERKPLGIGHIEYEKLRKPLAEKFRKPIVMP
jgi:hypothetical protein